MTPEDAAARHLFTGWLLGTKRFIGVVVAFYLILAAETWWEFGEQLAQGQCLGLPDFGCWASAGAKALVAGLVTASFCLVSLWFISYFTREVGQMIAEMFKESRFRRGFAQGHEQGHQEGHEQGHQEGREQGHQEGREQGLAQGIQLGATSQQEAWEGWNRRREQAAAAGREFTEPPPTIETARNGQ